MGKVDPYTTTLNKGNAYWMAKLSDAVYCKCSKKDPSPDNKKILEKLKSEDSHFKSVKGFSKNSSQAALIEHADYLCMAFRGTDEMSDWMDNANIFPENVLFGDFHRGFWKSVLDVWDGLYSRYDKLRVIKKRPLFLTGHSLGGAMATIAAAKLIHMDLPFTSVYTFGQPRTMSRDTSRIFNVEAKSRFYRFQNNNDLVTRVPARAMGYSHVGSYMYISEEKTLHNDPGFWFRFLDYFDGALNAATKKGIDGIEDHKMKKYLSAVRKWDFKD
ncbi:MAG: lipase family protein [Nitrospirota bacterium]